MNRIKYLDLKKEKKFIHKLILKKINKIILKSKFLLGSQLDIFEKKLCSFFSINYSAGVDSGTDALILILKALGIKHGDEVIVPCLTYVSTAYAVSLVGATPVFTDVSEDDYNIDINSIENKINSKTKAIIGTNFYGQMCDVLKLQKICKKNKIFFIEDAAQSHGAMYKKFKPGYFSIAAALSFYPGKNLGAYGDAGAVITNNKKIHSKIVLLRNLGAKKKYQHNIIGLNSRMDEIQAAVLNIKINYLNKINKKRILIAKKMITKIRNPNLILPKIKKNYKHVFHIFAVRVMYGKKLEFIKFLKKRKIETNIHYPKLVPFEKAYRYTTKKNNFKNGNKIINQLVSIPCNQYLTNKEVDHIIDSVNMFQ